VGLLRLTPTPRAAEAKPGRRSRNASGASPRYPAALQAGADPAVVTRWIREAQQNKEAAQRKLGTLPAITRKTEPPLANDEIRAHDRETWRHRATHPRCRRGEVRLTLRSRGHHHRPETHREDRDRKVEALASLL
jgi:hypothetical protein